MQMPLYEPMQFDHLAINFGNVYDNFNENLVQDTFHHVEELFKQQDGINKIQIRSLNKMLEAMFNKISEHDVEHKNLKPEIKKDLLIELATKADIEELKGRMQTLEAVTKFEIKDLKASTKADINELKGRIELLEVATKADINELRASTKADIKELKASTKADINELKGRIELLEIATKADINELSASTKADINELSASTKADSNELKGKIELLEATTKAESNELKARMESLEATTKAEINELKAYTKAEITELKGEFKSFKLLMNFLIGIIGLAVALYSPAATDLLKILKQYLII